MGGNNATYLMTTAPKFTSTPNIIDFNSLPYVQLSAWIWTICLPICFALGVFGNVMIIAVLHRLQTNRSALDRYFQCLAVADLCVNVTGPFQDWIQTVTDFQLFALNDVLCKTSAFVLNAAVTCSAWFVVVMVTHRAVSVVWPHRVNVVCTAKTSWVILVTIVIFASAAYSHFLYGMEVVGRVCVPREHYLTFLVETWVNVDILLYSVLPFVCLVISNVVLVTKLRKSVREAGDQFAATDRQHSGRKSTVNSITLTALVVSASFIVCTLPLAIRNIIDMTFFDSSEVKETPELEFNYFLEMVLFLITYLNFSLNFYLYCLTGKRFRKEFLKFIRGLVFCLGSPKR